MTIQNGDRVEFIGGVIPEQVRWANTDYPTELVIGKHYVVESVSVGRYCTKLVLNNVQGIFNSVHFKHV